jgi:hypothetical protein
MLDTPTKEPTQATANDTLIWQKSLPDYLSADGWSLTYALRGAVSIDITAQPSDAGYLISQAAPSASGNYYLQGTVTRDAQRFTIYSGALTLAADISAATTPYDGRSANRRVLDLIDLVISGRASRADLEYEVNFGGNTTRRFKFMSPIDLAKARGIYAQKVWREENPGKLGPAVNITFGRGSR